MGKRGLAKPKFTGKLKDRVANVGRCDKTKPIFGPADTMFRVGVLDHGEPTAHSATHPCAVVDRRLADLEPESPSSWVLVAVVPFFLTLMILAHLFFRRATAPRKPISRGTRITRKKVPTRIIYEL